MRNDTEALGFLAEKLAEDFLHDCPIGAKDWQINPPKEGLPWFCDTTSKGLMANYPGLCTGTPKECWLKYARGEG
jgi:hypothetical protein